MKSKAQEGCQESTDALMLYRSTARISAEAKKRIMEKITAAIDEGYSHIGDTFIFLHEDKLENVMLNRRFQSENSKFTEAIKPNT